MLYHFDYFIKKRNFLTGERETDPLHLLGIANFVIVQSLSPVQFLVTSYTVTHQASLSMGFPRQEYGSGFCFLLQGIFVTQGSNTHLLHWQADALPLNHQGSQFFRDS